MSPAPVGDILGDLVVGTGIVGLDPPPGSDGSAETGGQLSGLTHLALLVGDHGRGLAQHLGGDHAIRLERPVTGAVVFAVGLELPGLPGQPGQRATLDRAEVDRHQHVVGSGAQGSAGHVAEQRERVAELGEVGAIASADGVDHRQRESAVVPFQVLKHWTAAAPSARTSPIHAQGPAQAVVLAGIGQDALELAHGGTCTVAAELEQLTHVIAGLGAQGRGNIALPERSQAMGPWPLTASRIRLVWSTDVMLPSVSSAMCALMAFRSSTAKSRAAPTNC